MIICELFSGTQVAYDTYTTVQSADAGGLTIYIFSLNNIGFVAAHANTEIRLLDISDVTSTPIGSP